MGSRSTWSCLRLEVRACAAAARPAFRRIEHPHALALRAVVVAAFMQAPAHRLRGHAGVSAAGAGHLLLAITSPPCPADSRGRPSQRAPASVAAGTKTTMGNRGASTPGHRAALRGGSAAWSPRASKPRQPPHVPDAGRDALRRHVRRARRSPRTVVLAHRQRTSNAPRGQVAPGVLIVHVLRDGHQPDSPCSKRADRAASTASKTSSNPMPR